MADTEKRGSMVGAGIVGGLVGGAIGAAAAIALAAAAPGVIPTLQPSQPQAAPRTPAAHVQLPVEELPLLTGRASVSGDHLFVDLYNGTDRRVSAIEIEASVEGRFTNRRLLAEGRYPVQPRTGGSFGVKHGDGYILHDPRQRVTWRLIGATAVGE